MKKQICKAHKKNTHNSNNNNNNNTIITYNARLTANGTHSQL